MTTTKTNPLLQAADYIAEVGWCRGDWYRADGKACLAGAVGVVTGALVPLSREAREKELRRYVKEHPTFGWTENQVASALDGRGELSGVAVYKWSKSKRAIARYGKALTALARQVDADRYADLVRQHDEDISGRRQTGWYTTASVEQRAKLEATWAADRMRLGEGPVVELNDNDDSTPKKRTTKAKAIKLLRTAAEHY